MKTYQHQHLSAFNLLGRIGHVVVSLAVASKHNTTLAK